MRFQFSNEEGLFLEDYNSSRPNPLILNLKANKMMSKGLLCHLVSVNDHEIPSIDSLPIVNEFQYVFTNHLSGAPPPR